MAQGMSGELRLESVQPVFDTLALEVLHHRGEYLKEVGLYQMVNRRIVAEVSWEKPISIEGEPIRVHQLPPGPSMPMLPATASMPVLEPDKIDQVLHEIPDDLPPGEYRVTQQALSNHLAKLMPPHHNKIHVMDWSDTEEHVDPASTQVLDARDFTAVATGVLPFVADDIMAASTAGMTVPGHDGELLEDEYEPDILDDEEETAAEIAARTALRYLE